MSSTEQVSPTQLENFCLSEPQKLISDIAVAGVNEQRGVDLQVPRAWIVLSDEGRKLGADATIQILEKWTKQSLDPSKWLSGGIAVVDQVIIISLILQHKALTNDVAPEVARWEDPEASIAREIQPTASMRMRNHIHM